MGRTCSATEQITGKALIYIKIWLIVLSLAVIFHLYATHHKNPKNKLISYALG